MPCWDVERPNVHKTPRSGVTCLPWCQERDHVAGRLVAGLLQQRLSPCSLEMRAGEATRAALGSEVALRIALQTRFEWPSHRGNWCLIEPASSPAPQTVPGAIWADTCQSLLAAHKSPMPPPASVWDCHGTGCTQEDPKPSRSDFSLEKAQSRGLGLDQAPTDHWHKPQSKSQC